MTTILSTKKSYIDPKQLPRVERAELGRIHSYLRPYRAHALLVLLLVSVSAGLNLLPPLFLKAIVDHLERVIHNEARGDRLFRHFVDLRGLRFASQLALVRVELSRIESPGIGSGF